MPTITTNEAYETEYTINTEPMYGAKRDVGADADLIFQNNTLCPHAYSIPRSERTDFTNRNTYSIDPPGCEDADDAFSLFIDESKDNALFLAIHIADPTEFVSPAIESALWADIKERVVTRYPSNRAPVHLMPKDVVDRASLMVNQYGDTKNAITVLTEIDPDTFAPRGRIQLLFSTVRVCAAHALTYARAAEMVQNATEPDPDNDMATTIARGLCVASALHQRRVASTVGASLSDLAPSMVVFSSPPVGIHLARASDTVLDMQKMIAEFAIFANAFVGEHLKIHMGGMGIFRTCSTGGWIDTVAAGISGEDLLNEIIVNGIQADYLSENAAHDLVGMPEYCHFTSPIRRLSDCVCHYLVKYIHLCATTDATTERVATGLVNPFPDNSLTVLADMCQRGAKSMRKLQYRDTKFRLLQTMNQMLISLPHRSINLTFFITGYTGGFLNLIVCRIDEHKVHMSYSLRLKNFPYDQIRENESDGTVTHTQYTIPVTHVNCLGKFDSGSIPELDAYVAQLGA